MPMRQAAQMSLALSLWVLTPSLLDGGGRSEGLILIAFLKIVVKDASPKSHHVNPFKVCNPLAFSTYTMFCKHHHYVVLEQFITL